VEGFDVVPWGVAVAALGGLAIGVEREWSGHAAGPTARFAGLRTFTLLGGLSGVAGWLWSMQVQSLAVVLLAAAATLVIVAYVAASRTDVDGTTEVGALVVLAAGTLAGLGHLAIASGIIALTGLILLEKTRLHALIEKIDDEELHAAMRFAVMAVVVLPLLPVGPYGPSNTVRPRELWLLVLFFSGLSFAAYIARRVVGVSHGDTLAGTLGGLISSTSVTLTFARASRDPGVIRPGLAHGAIAASTVLFVRVLVAAAVISPLILRDLVQYFALPLTVGAVMLFRGIRAAPAPETTTRAPRNPLQFSAALQMALLFQGVLIVIMLVNRLWGNMGVTVAGALLGLADVDALTVSMARNAGATIPPEIAARAIAIGILSNTLLKAAVATIVGVGAFRLRTVRALAAVALALAISIGLGVIYT